MAGTPPAPRCRHVPSYRSEAVLEFDAEDVAAAGDGAAVLLVVGDVGHPSAVRLAEDVEGDDAVPVDQVARPLEPHVVLEIVLVAVRDVDLLRDEAEQRTLPRIEGRHLPGHVARGRGERDRGDQREDQVRRTVGARGGRLQQQSSTTMSPGCGTAGRSFTSLPR